MFVAIQRRKYRALLIVNAINAPFFLFFFFFWLPTNRSGIERENDGHSRVEKLDVRPLSLAYCALHSSNY
jgi:hypothetical protein